ncbi:hypothetical protein RHGRI_031180 [Rhododendron griersonianum]|uniref:DNA-directed RNA polymerase n=1 Tax=Rhododendron griersonianum TaxID=479676 RepID=A0AAV6ICP7_9ERIC|nr:hypothetical protein RHGRI_031180 [Rhododendron griersonianum]
MMDGDIVFVNRPLATHKHSVQALSVYVHEDHTVKINPLICGPLSADFDGDYIHLFYPQSLAAKAEVLELFSVEKQLLSSHFGNLNLQLAIDALLSLKIMFENYFLTRPAAQQLAIFLVRKSELLTIDFSGDVMLSIVSDIVSSIFSEMGPDEATFIDLDMNKMEHYYELDQQIVSCNAHITNGEHQADNSVSIEAYRTAYSDQSNTVEDVSHARDPAGLFSESQYVALDKLFETQKKRPHPLNKLLCTIISTWEAVGFHGRSGMYLDATGVHMQHWLDPPHTFGFVDWDSDCIYLTIEDDLGRATPGSRNPSRTASCNAFENGEAFDSSEAELAHMRRKLASPNPIQSNVNVQSSSDVKNVCLPVSYSYAVIWVVP